MKIVRFKLGRSTRYGVIENGEVFSIEGNIFDRFHVGKFLCHINDVRLLAPVQPKIVVGVGQNYRTPSMEALQDISHELKVFLKPPSSVIGHLDHIIYPRTSNDVRCGGELAVVMKQKAVRVPEDRALDYVLGYTCGNDVTAFDIAERDAFATRAKSFYSFCPLGPCIATDINVENLKIVSKLNGALKQQGSTSGMIFGISRIISHVAEFMALEPGDVILTGTVLGGSFAVNFADTVEVEIEGIGLLQNTVVREGASQA